MSNIADMVVTYTDGHSETIEGVLYQAGKADVNPIVVTGTKVEVELRTGRVVTLLGVRRYELNPPTTSTGSKFYKCIYGDHIVRSLGEKWEDEKGQRTCPNLTIGMHVADLDHRVYSFCYQGPVQG